MAKKLTEIIGNRNTEAETWVKIRAGLPDEIAAAWRLWVEYDCSHSLGRVLGLTEQYRLGAIQRILSVPMQPDAGFLMRRLDELKAVSNPPEAYYLFQSYLNKFGHAWEEILKQILAASLPIAEGELKAAVATEAEFFSDAGLPRQETALSAGATRVVAKLKNLAQRFEPREHHPRLVFQNPDPAEFKEIFADEQVKYEARCAAARAEIAAEKDSAA
jgi:hypothetical protein